MGREGDEMEERPLYKMIIESKVLLLESLEKMAPEHTGFSMQFKKRNDSSGFSIYCSFPKLIFSSTNSAAYLCTHFLQILKFGIILSLQRCLLFLKH